MEPERKGSFVLSQWTQASEPETWHSSPGFCGSALSSFTPTPASLGTISEVQEALAWESCEARGLRPDRGIQALGEGLIPALCVPTIGQRAAVLQEYRE